MSQSKEELSVGSEHKLWLDTASSLGSVSSAESAKAQSVTGKKRGGVRAEEDMPPITRITAKNNIYRNFTNIIY